MQTIIALDIETTGLDPTRDAVIEVGLVRFQGARIEDTWQSLINPGRPLPPFIVQLTGIDDAMVANAPRITSILNELQEKAGDLPVLGHNVGFDISFLQQQGLFHKNQLIDTYDLASVLLPDAGRYRLDALASALGVVPQQRHRALEDASTTHQVYLRLCNKVQQLPKGLLEEIVHLGENHWILKRSRPSSNLAVLLQRSCRGMNSVPSKSRCFRPLQMHSLPPNTSLLKPGQGSENLLLI
jgi:ATP-dependent DNA helicase DinG